MKKREFVRKERKAKSKGSPLLPSSLSLFETDSLELKLA